MIVRDTEAEARDAATRLLSKLDEATGAAIRAKLAAVDAARLPAGLETATETTLGLYGALGFRVTGRFDFAPGQPMWTMWREAVR